jgi:hypothetical protein
MDQIGCPSRISRQRTHLALKVRQRMSRVGIEHCVNAIVDLADLRIHCA